ncbi:hypothetical protein [Corallococcus aberystwythensis]|uniref:hypothetical protein n=1 Tax=Corallococcus aberystwythensis TaxID=2316722 RepID=UPI0011C3A923|nr:hypothetical protein [Corallococcus aberystwythensis]
MGAMLQRFFLMWPYTDAHELAPEELPAFERKGYKSVWYCDGRLERAELVGNGEVLKVDYHDRTQLGPALLEQHHARYGQVPFWLIGPKALVDGLLMQESQRYDEAGLLREFVQEWSSPDGNRELKTLWFSPKREFNRSWEIEYDEGRRAVRRIERDFDGAIIHVTELDEYD